jgi:hypothetical protein
MLFLSKNAARDVIASPITSLLLLAYSRRKIGLGTASLKALCAIIKDQSDRLSIY